MRDAPELGPLTDGLLRPRLVPRPGEPALLRVGLRARPWSDLYHRALTVRWWVFLLAGSALYLGANVVFAALYLLDPGGINGARPGSFADAFFFSVQTLATIGYGQESPASLFTNLLVTVEVLFGLIAIALSTGLVFARVSRPTSRVMFSRVAVVGPFNGVPTLSVRLGNERRSQILEAEVSLTLLRDERTREGETFRRFHTLALARPHTPVFSLTFSVLHVLDETSPLHGATAASLLAGRAELLVAVTGLDETLGQTVHARHSYSPDEVLFGHRFLDIFGATPGGRLAIDYRRFHDAEPIG